MKWQKKNKCRYSIQFDPQKESHRKAMEILDEVDRKKADIIASALTGLDFEELKKFSKHISPERPKKKIVPEKNFFEEEKPKKPQKVREPEKTFEPEEPEKPYDNDFANLLSAMNEFDDLADED